MEMDEYIKREDVLRAYEEEQRRQGLWRFEALIESIPSADVAPVRHGRIIETIENGRMKRVFSCCGTDFTEMTCWMTPNFCPECGAKIDGV